MMIPRLIVALLGLGLLLFAFRGTDQQPPEVIRITHAAFMKSQGPDRLSLADQPWENRRLPDFWRLHRPNDAGFGWYRADFEVVYQPDSPWAAHVAFANSAFALRLNGVELARETGFDAVHLSARASPPHLVPLPAALLHPGSNRLEIQLRVERDINGGLSVIELGPQQWLQQRHQSQALWRIELPRALTMAGLVAALFMALLWLRRRRERIYPWFCALAALWGLRALYFTGDADWLSPLQRLLGLGGGDLFLAASFSLGFALLAIVVNRFAHHTAPWPERLALMLCIVLPLAVAPLGNQVLEPLLPAWYGLAMVFAAWAALTAATLARRERHWSYWLILVGIVVMTIAGLHDWLVVTGRLRFDPTPWLGYGPPVMLAAMVTALGGRYFQAFDEAARLNRELEHRVTEKTREIERHYERIAQLERVAAVAEERDRLMREMHDGVGSQLITTLHALEKGRLDHATAAELLRGCIDDLRLVIDSLDAGTQSMADALANLRFRLEPRLAAGGIASTWRIDRTEIALPPGVVLQLLRILQEAVSNVLKHSCAQQVGLSWNIAPGEARLHIADNGSGFASPTVPQGRGLANMRQRAQRIGARMELHSSATGTEITVALPL
ncbi:sensor histidine kinase [Ferrovibrio sp.]|uniref:sensor histidine kinase n=1 Tax=Ferrovibrio sp. TaxID=1917215 RepID=UPI003D2D2BC8